MITLSIPLAFITGKNKAETLKDVDNFLLQSKSLLAWSHRDGDMKTQTYMLHHSPTVLLSSRWKNNLSDRVTAYMLPTTYVFQNIWLISAKLSVFNSYTG